MLATRSIQAVFFVGSICIVGGVVLFRMGW